ncbi:MAG: DUF58 domain-containing protein [Candidatus Eremiobacterota bacterium]
MNEDLHKTIRRIEITTSRLVEEVFAGQYESLFKGQGMEFAEVREYLPGDDVRSIDWNVTARTGRPFVKRFVEERELTVMLLVDASRSLDFGSGTETKRQLASELGAVLALSAMRNNDKVGLMLFTDRVERYIPPRKGRRHGLRLIREILKPEPKGVKTDVAAALDHFTRIHKRQALVFVISDFLGDGFERALKRIGLRHDVSAFRLYDPREDEIPPIGRIRLRDLETGELVVLDSSSTEFQSGHRKFSLERRSQLKRLFDRSGVDYAEFSAGEPLVTPLVRFFAGKAVRRHRRRAV